MVRRNLLLAWSFGLVASLSFAGTGLALAQDAKVEVKAPAAAPAAKIEKAAEAKPEEAKKDEAKPAEPKKDEAKKEEAKAPEAPAELPPPTVPPEVMAKIEAARHAVAEAIVAAQDAGLVETSIDPPPILDILVQGYAIDARTLKNTAGKKPFPVSPEVFGAWFTGYGKTEGINYQTDVRIVNPSAGLKAWYDQRASILNRHIEAVRKTKPAPAPKAEEKKEEAKPAPAPKAEEKKEEAKPAPAPKAEEKKEEPKAEVKKEEAKPEVKAEAVKEAPKSE